MSTGTLLLVDDHEEHLASLAAGFGRSGYDVLTAGSGTEALKILNSQPVDVIVSDLNMPGMGGIELLEAVRERGSATQVILITAFGTIESAVEAMQKGAFTYVTKPVELKQLRASVAKAMEMQDLRRENKELRISVDRKYGFEEMIGQTREMEQLVQRCRTIADTRATVLIEGESGTGKELVARALHRHSSRASKPFIPINLAALSENLVESELFGHEKGSFTGAAGKRQGFFELANGGTLFLDEIGEIPANIQVKLLRVLETKDFLRVGGTEPVQVDVRLIAATNRSLPEEVEEGRFREDLYYRLSVVRVDMPPLRARANDIPLMVERFLQDFAHEHGKPVPRLSKRCLTRLMQFPWPGNVRQLKNIMENLVLFADGKEIEPEDLPPEIQEGSAESVQIKIGTPLDQIERQIIERTLIFANSNRTHAAELLGISRRTLLRKIQELGLEA